jgi:hypothetical protein
MNDSDLLSEELIVGNSRACQNRPAIYFLIKDGKVVYVGQSKNVNERIGDHITRRSKPFDAYYAVYCDANEINATERGYIEKFQPLYNSGGNRAYSVDKHCDAILGAARSSC